MGTEKRARQKARHQAVIEQARQEAAAQKRKQRLINYGGLAIVFLGLAAVVVFLLTNDDSEEPTATPSTSVFTSLEPLGDDGTDDSSAPELPTVTVPPAGAAISGETPCPADDGSAERTTSFENPPPSCIDPAKAYTAEMVTSEGTIMIELSPDLAPDTVNNFVVLSRYHYYDGVAFHRVISDFMIQTGDAVGPQPGTGGPGYAIADENPDPTYVYQPGDLAMANSGPDTGGSQFFIVTKADGVDWLQGGHALFGTVTDGLDIVSAIEALDSGDGLGTPSTVATIESITITEA